MRTASFGSISSGTMRPEDLIPEFVSELRALRGALPRDLYQLARQYEAGTLDGDGRDRLLDGLFDALNDYAPAYGYFGAHPGDGADYGFWLYEDFQQDILDNGGLVVDDLSAVPRAYRGEVLHINDHGNATLYCATSRGLREVWAVV